MDALEPKKLAIVRILQILQTESDETHPLKQEDIARHLNDDYGITVERKAIGRSISMLKEAGYEIESSRSGSWLAGREFTESELRLLIDCVLSSRHISARYSKDLIDKLCTLASRHFRSHVKYIHSVNEWEKSDNGALFYNIELIDEAIERKKQIKFDYNKYGADKKLHRTAAHTASPYQLILHNQRYYLMARNEKWKNMGYYRLDRITNMSVTDLKAAPITTVEGYERGINYKELSTALPYMYTDKPERVEFIAEEGVIDQVVDWFGKDIRIEKHGEKQFKVGVKVSLMAMEHWALQYSGYVTVTSPQTLADNIRWRLREAAKSYKEIL